MLIIKIIAIFLLWTLIGFLVSVCTSTESTLKDDERVVFAIFLWPIALIMRVSKLIFCFLIILYSGLKKEIKALFEI